MAEGKRYFWLKLHDDFFTSKRIKKLRKIAGGDTYLIIYLKMQLKTLKTNGLMEFTGLESDIAEEIALDIDEEPDNVRVTLNYLLSNGLAETNDRYIFFPYAVENTGSEGSSAKRMRDLRERIASQSNALPSQCDTAVTHALRIGDGEKEKETNIELEINTEIEKDEPAAPKPYPDYSPDPQRTCLRSDTDISIPDDLIKEWAVKVKKFLDHKWDPAGMYKLAMNKGVTKKMIDDYLSKNGGS